MEQRYDLDSILDEIGYTGRSQILYFVLILFITFYTGVHSLAYVFTASDLNYRCYIEECDSAAHPTYNPGWLKYAVPFDKSSGLPEQCYKYLFTSHNNTSSDLTCTASDFGNGLEVKCNRYVFENEEKTILTEFNLTCNENKWRLTLPGTVHNTGLLFNLLLIGYISDRFGRKAVFVISPILGAVIGVIEPFAWNYAMYICLKFMETLFSGGTYMSGVVLAIELVTPPYRIVVVTVIFLSQSLGKLFLGFTAMLIDNWKIQTIVNFVPSLVAVSYIWIIPESLQWLLVKNRYKEIADILLRIIKWNNVEVSPEIKELLREQPEIMAQYKTNSDIDNDEHEAYPIYDAFKSTPMMIRLILLSICWIANVFVFYGLTLISVSIGGNKYTNFMIANLMEVPGCALVIYCSHRAERKKLLCSSLVLSGISLFSYSFVPDLYWLKLIVFMIGKFAISVSFSTIYIYTPEMVPTNLRQTLMGLCSAFGRIGTIIATQAPLLELIMDDLPIYLFGTTALIAGLLSLKFPETLNTKLPHTMDEALRIGKKT